MQVNPKIIKNQFEKSLETYNQNAIVQEIMAKKMVLELKNWQKDFETILELGCGSGLLTKKLQENLSFKSYFANDLVEKSKNYITKIIPDAKFYIGNALKIKPSLKMDLIISNAMFQWFKNLEKISSHCENLLNKDGILAFSTFSPDNFKEIRALTGLSLEYKTCDEIINVFSKNFQILHKEEFIYTMKFSNPLELLAHIKKTGVNSLASQHWTFKDVKEFCDNYKNKYPEITLTYSPIIIICKKL